MTVDCIHEYRDNRQSMLFIHTTIQGLRRRFSNTVERDRTALAAAAKHVAPLKDWELLGIAASETPGRKAAAVRRAYTYHAEDMASLRYWSKQDSDNAQAVRENLRLIINGG